MQSIYRFREADVGLFLAAQRDRRIGGVALEPLTLTRNFRSQQGLVDWVNVTFSSVFSSYGRSCAPGRSRSNRQRRPADRVPMPRSPSISVTTLCEKRRWWSPASVMRSQALLKRSRCLSASVPTLPRYCRRYVPAKSLLAAVELDHLSERQTVLDLCSLTHALVQPDDRLRGSRHYARRGAD